MSKVAEAKIPIPANSRGNRIDLPPVNCVCSSCIGSNMSEVD